MSFSSIFFLYIEYAFLKYNSFFPIVYILHPITVNIIQEGENTSSKSVQLDYNSLKVLFQGRGFNTRIITGVITIKACNGVTEKCADNRHFTDATKAYLQILFIIEKFKRINDVTE